MMRTVNHGRSHTHPPLVSFPRTYTSIPDPWSRRLVIPHRHRYILVHIKAEVRAYPFLIGIYGRDTSRFVCTKHTHTNAQRSIYPYRQILTIKLTHSWTHRIHILRFGHKREMLFGAHACVIVRYNNQALT